MDASASPIFLVVILAEKLLIICIRLLATAFGFPRAASATGAEGHNADVGPLVWDQASASMARGEIQLHQREVCLLHAPWSHTPTAPWSHTPTGATTLKRGTVL